MSLATEEYLTAGHSIALLEALLEEFGEQLCVVDFPRLGCPNSIRLAALEPVRSLVQLSVLRGAVGVETNAYNGICLDRRTGILRYVCPI